MRMNSAGKSSFSASVRMATLVHLLLWKPQPRSDIHEPKLKDDQSVAISPYRTIQLYLDIPIYPGTPL